MKGVLILAHGSRQKSTEQTLEAVTGLARSMLPGSLMQVAYMEFGAPNIEAGLSGLLAQGVEEIAVVPYFLFDGIHIREDIPQELDKFRAEHPGVKISMGRPFGEDSRLAEILADRVRECL